MSHAEIKIPDHVIGILSTCASGDGNRLVLGATLSRNEYMQVDKILCAAGGKWDRRAQGHLFEQDAQDVIDTLIETRSVVDTKKAFQAFYTPAPLAALVAERANILPGMKVLEPSAGEGALAQAALDATGHEIDLWCVEVREKTCERMPAGNNWTAADFMTLALKDLQHEGEGEAFDRILMNPPFTGQQDIKHVIHALTFLKSGGILVAIMSAGILYRENKVAREFRDFVAQHGGTIDRLPDGVFKESGTGVSTVIVRIEKP